MGISREAHFGLGIGHKEGDLENDRNQLKNRIKFSIENGSINSDICAVAQSTGSTQQVYLLQICHWIRVRSH